jgi:outer membrane receptor protein involved in Fe transport
VAWQALDSLRFAVDYWDIKQENKIDEFPFGFVYTNNCNDQASTVCERGDPLPGDTLGPLQLIHTTFTNIGEQSVTGVDFGVYYDTDFAGGTLRLALDYSRLLDFERVELNSAGDRFVTRELTGEYEYPEDRFVLSGDWSTASWGFTAAVNYIGKFEDAPDADFDGTLDYDSVRTRSVDSFVTVNLQARYTGFEGLTLSLGLENALDEDPPFAIGDGDSDLYGYVSSQHDPRGRFAYGKVTYRF